MNGELRAWAQTYKCINCNFQKINLEEFVWSATPRPYNELPACEECDRLAQIPTESEDK